MMWPFRKTKRENVTATVVKVDHKRKPHIGDALHVKLAAEVAARQQAEAKR